MRTIHKYQFEAGKLEQEIVMPEGATVLSVQNQNEKLTMWAAVSTGARLEKRKFLIALTGREEPMLQEVGRYLMKFIGTVQFDGGNFVCHVFENGPDKMQLPPLVSNVVQSPAEPYLSPEAIKGVEMMYRWSDGERASDAPKVP